MEDTADRGEPGSTPSPDTKGPERGPWGVILAGGQSRRYGSPKALAEVGGARIIDRVRTALERTTTDVVLSANEPELFQDLGLPTFPDARPGLGPLAGIYTALLRAREAGRPGILVVACDMPFPCEPLLERLRRDAFGPEPGYGSGSGSGSGSGAGLRPDLVLPESRG
ncbi:MAG: molybdenum cofactor guanylyltransferase, partial [Gemmatimonadota bacterium]